MNSTATSTSSPPFGELPQGFIINNLTARQAVVTELFLHGDGTLGHSSWGKQRSKLAQTVASSSSLSSCSSISSTDVALPCEGVDLSSCGHAHVREHVLDIGNPCVTAYGEHRAWSTPAAASYTTHNPKQWLPQVLAYVAQHDCDHPGFRFECSPLEGRPTPPAASADLFELTPEQNAHLDQADARYTEQHTRATNLLV